MSDGGQARGPGERGSAPRQDDDGGARRPDDGGARRPPRLVFLTLSAGSRLRRWIGARGEGRGLSAAACGVLLYVAANPGAGTGQVATAVDASPAGLSGLLARMEQAGLLTRTPDPADRRTIRLNLTDDGREALAAVRSSLKDLNGHISAGFTAEELAVVARWLTHVGRVLN